MKYYAFIDTFLREVTLFTTKTEVKAEYTLRKTIDSTLPFIGCEHYKIAVVNVPYIYTGNVLHIYSTNMPKGWRIDL